MQPKQSNNRQACSEQQGMAYHDPMLHLFKLLMKIDRRVNGAPELNENNEVIDESDKRDRNNTS